jgi:hypothetical protein
VRAGEAVAAIELDPAHCERLFRTAAYAALRDGLLTPAEKIVARLVPGRVRQRHGTVYCLDSCAVELLGARRRLVARHEFPRGSFAAFAAGRATHLLVEAGSSVTGAPVAYSLHASDSSDDPFPVQIPRLAPLSVARLAAAAVACRAPDDEWVATFMTPAVASGLRDIGRLSLATGLEAAGRIHTRVGFDAARRCFVRILDRLVISRDTQATALSVVSSAASWADFLATVDAGGPRAPSSVHTHLHLNKTPPNGEGAPGDHLLAAAASMRAADGPCISINDIVTHYTAFPDPLSAALIVSLFPDRQVVTLYGYAADAQLREEPGYWSLTAGGNAAGGN